MAVDPVSLAITAALTAANMALTAMQKFEGPRVKGAPATVADYGTPLNYFLGTRLLNGPCFFAKPIQEVRKKRKGKGGKQVTYTGFGSFAIHIADNEIGAVLRVYFDNHLVFDVTGSGEKIYPLADDYELAAHMRIYLGTETQDPDPDMLAYIEARDGVAGVTPAYRGTSYIYFEGIPLEMLGNRYPDVKVLATTNGAVETSAILWRLYFPDGCQGDVAGERRIAINEIEMFDSNESTTDLTGDGSGTYGDADASDFTPPNVPSRAFDNGSGSASNWITHIGADVGAWIEWEFNENVTVRSFSIRSSSSNGAAWAPASVTFQVNTGDGWETVQHFEGPLGFSGNEQTIRFDTNLDAVTSDRATWAPTTLNAFLTFLAERAGLEEDEYDFDLVGGEEHQFDGFNWAQSGGQQAEALCDLFDVDMRPHEFTIQALPRGGPSAGAIPTTEFVADEVPYILPDKSDSSLPARVFLTYADSTAAQNPNVAMPQGGEFSGGEISIDMQTLALPPTRAQQLTERRQRRERFGRINAEFGLTRQRFALEAGDVFTPSFDGEPMTMRCTKATVGADGKFPVEWSRDDPAIAVLPGSVGAPAQGIVPDEMPDPVAAEGFVLDTALLIDAHDQTAPLAYLVAGPEEPGIWTGADFAVSDTGDLDSYTEGWDGIASDAGAIIGSVTGTLPDALPWVPDMGSSISVVLNVGELTAATLDELILDGTRNLVAIQSGDGWELTQFMTPTLTAPLTYTITGFLRGVRGTEWAMAGHAPGDAFVVLDNAKLRTLGADEIGDEDFYIVSSTGAAVDQDEAFPVDYTGSSHKPYAPVHGLLTFDTGASDDITIDATRRTRIGGNTLDGQDVPLGEASESWSADIYDGVTFKRTITGTSLPLVYTSAAQTTDFGAPVTTGFEVYLYQVSPTLSLRGYPLALAA